MGKLIYRAPVSLKLAVEFKPSGSASCRGGTCVVSGEAQERFEALPKISALLESGKLTRAFVSKARKAAPAQVAEDPMESEEQEPQSSAPPAPPAPATRPQPAAKPVPTGKAPAKPAAKPTGKAPVKKGK